MQPLISQRFSLKQLTICITFLSLNFIYPTQSNPITSEWYLICEIWTASGLDRPTFLANYISALDSLEAALESRGFENKVDGNGDSSTTVYTFAQCMQDLQFNDCETCLSSMLQLIQQCRAIKEGKRAGRLYMGGCFLRFDDHNFTNDITSFDDRIICGKHEDPHENFDHLAEKLVSNLANEAPKKMGFTWVI
ncbi:hypothetical protein ACH5RR_026585 [Cinchona calisaya]|uniref:Gnk2-homologous domain-containing protein n=1 Tax=Cinchona calisaya TaxID=153742 RepID=A0ABD2Z300_9GENT